MTTRHSGWSAFIVIVAISGLLMTGLPLAAEDNQPPSVPRQELSLQERFWSGDLPVTLDMTSAKSVPAVPQSPTAIVADWAYLVYQSYRDGNWEIYLAHDGQEFRLTNNAASDARPRLNRGSTKVAFNSNRDGNYEVYTMNVDGSNVRRLTYNTASDSAPAWSPDGTKIAFMSNRDGNYEIYVMNADGSGQTRLTYLPSTADVTPVWSPDGSQIAWVQASGSYGAIDAMNANGSGQHQVLGGQPYLADAQWSPSGSRFAFDSIPNPNSFPFSGIYVVNADGSGLRASFFGGSWVDYWAGSWMPDAANVMFTRVEYVIQNNQVYIGAAYIESNNVDNPTTTARYTSSGLDMNPDQQLADLQPPQSRVNPLPTYSRSAGTTVSWSGSDSGVAGIASYDVQYRIGTAGAWTDWQMNTADTSATFVGSAGQTVYFRSRARDRAGNIETWPSPDAYDASTTLYESQITGMVSDVRDHPIPGLIPSILPAPINAPVSNANGLYTAYTFMSGTHQIAGGRTGYGILPTMTLNIPADTAVEHYLPPMDNQIINGNFESGGGTLTGWIVGGNISPTSVTSAHSGSGAAFLGAAKYPMLGTSEVITGGIGTEPKIAVDTNGVVHVVYHQANGIFYSRRDNSGSWSLPTKLDDGNFAPAIAVTQSGDVHVVWSNGTNILYRNLPHGGTWSATTQIGAGTNVDIAADALEEIHIAYQYTEAPYTIPFSYHMTRLITNTWTSPVVILPGEQPRIAVDSHNQIHAIINNVGTSGTLRYCEPYGQYWTCGLEFYGVSDARIKVDQQDIVHVFFTKYDLTSGYAWKRITDPTFFTESALPDHNGFGDMAVDSAGAVYLVNSDAQGTYLRFKPSGQSWLPTIVVDPAPNSKPVSIVDAQGMVHLAYEAGPLINHYRSSLPLPATGVSSISQSVLIPSDLHHPTLSLIYQVDRYGLDDSTAFAVSISNGLTSTILLSKTTNYANWTHSWVDLEPWSGQTLTITLSAIAAHPFDHSFVTLDEISLGSWLTPVIADVTPNQIEARVSTIITITGDNFIMTPTVRLNEIPVTDVLFVDAHTLQVTVPDSLPLGRYDVWVANPGGQESTLSRGLLVGREVFLPLLQK